jgi:hypothetical protein
MPRPCTEDAGGGGDFDDFQRNLDQALGGEASRLAAWWTDATAGEAALSVYRNTVAKGAVEALSANYPTVERVVGAAWFRSAALRFSRAHPPQRAALFDYGEGFADWLEGFEPAAALPYLPDLARIDRLWTEACFAEDSEPLAAEAFAAAAPVLAGARVGLHPSVRWRAFAWDAPALWRQNRPPAQTPSTMRIEEGSVLAVVLRQADEVQVLSLPVTAAPLLAVCAASGTVGAAAEALSLHHAPDGLAAILATLITAGAFASLESPT